MNAKEIFKMELASLGIRQIEIWIKQIDSKCESEIDKIKQEHNGRPQRNIEEIREVMESLMVNLNDCRERYNHLKLNSPKTVGDLVRMFRYNFTPRTASGLTRGTIQELRRKVIQLGLTHEDWPGLCHRSKFLQILSKENTKKLPLTEVFQSRRYDEEMCKYMQCSREELAQKTLTDFISIQPNLAHRRNVFFRANIKGLRRIKVLLLRKGLNSNDGIFLNCKLTLRQANIAEIVIS